MIADGSLEEEARDKSSQIIDEGPITIIINQKIEKYAITDIIEKTIDVLAIKKDIEMK